MGAGLFAESQVDFQDQLSLFGCEQFPLTHYSVHGSVQYTERMQFAPSAMPL